ncbi:MAG: hypothetical protein JWP44_2784 [Mucilaginibacter sp.]|nr:hypothetical protein [Mucilaginibacter sp.]
MSQRISEEVKQIEVFLEYLELMVAILPNFDYQTTKRSVEQTRQFLKAGTKLELAQRLPELKDLLERQAKSLMKDCPPKKSIEHIAHEFSLLKNKEDIINTGVAYAFLNGLMDLKKFNWYTDTPYHYRISVGPLKGGGGIEEEFLLKDAFILYKKAETNFALLETLRKEFNHQVPLDKTVNNNITDIKYEVANYSRLSILTFYSFIECFINSIGFDFLYRNEQNLSANETLILKGLKKNGGYMNLKHRIEGLQTIIRPDKQLVLNVTDDQQRNEPFVSFFDQFEALRNASVHYSPIKHSIWLSPQEWIQKSRSFCDVALQVGLEIWKACYPGSDGPLYMGKLDKTKQLQLANRRLAAASELHKTITKENEPKNL